MSTDKSDKNSEVTRTSLFASGSKPHRRVLLTQPTTLPHLPTEVTPTAEVATHHSEPSPNNITLTPEGEQTRMTVFLSASELEQLEATWVQMHRSSARPSKGDIVRAAMAMAFTNTDNLEKELRKRKGLPD